MRIIFAALTMQHFLDPLDHKVDNALMVTVGIEVPPSFVHADRLKPKTLHHWINRRIVGITVPSTPEHRVNFHPLVRIAIQFDQKFQGSTGIGLQDGLGLMRVHWGFERSCGSVTWALEGSVGKGRGSTIRNFSSTVQFE